MPAIIRFFGNDPSPTGASFPECLAAVRRLRGPLQRKLAERLGVAPSRPMGWEAGRQASGYEPRSHFRRLPGESQQIVEVQKHIELTRILLPRWQLKFAMIRALVPVKKRIDCDYHHWSNSFCQYGIDIGRN